jgi:hypothetical protein
VELSDWTLQLPGYSTDAFVIQQGTKIRQVLSPEYNRMVMKRHVCKWMARLSRSLPVCLMLQAVLWPLCAPWVDPAFAGRQPEHDHLYLGKIDPDHAHDNRAREPHLHHQEETSPVPTGVVFLPNREGSGHITAVLPPLFALLGVQPDETFIATVPETLYRLQGIIVSPPEQPPRF